MKQVILFIIITIAIGLVGWAITYNDPNAGCPTNGGGGWVCN